MARRIRSIKPEFFSDQLLGMLPIDTHFLALGLISIADDEGWFNANPSYIMAEVFPLRIFADNSPNVPRMLVELSSIEFARLYRDARGCEFGVVDGFARHQRVDKPRKSVISQRIGEFTLISQGANVRRIVVESSSNDRRTFAVGLEGNGLEGNGSSLTTFGDTGLNPSYTDSHLNQNPNTEQSTREESQITQGGRNGIEYGERGHTHERGGGNDGDDGQGCGNDRVAAPGDRAAEGRERASAAPAADFTGASLDAQHQSAYHRPMGSDRHGIDAGDMDSPQIQAIVAKPANSGAGGANAPPTTRHMGEAEITAGRPKSAGKKLQTFGRTAMEMELPDAHAVWTAAPAMARGRSSTIEFIKAWREQLKNGGIPPVAELLDALEAWRRSKKWAENGGEYIEGLHRWIARRQWENLPLSAMEIANEQMREIDAAIVGGLHGA